MVALGQNNERSKRSVKRLDIQKATTPLSQSSDSSTDLAVRSGTLKLHLIKPNILPEALQAEMIIPRSETPDLVMGPLNPRNGEETDQQRLARLKVLPHPPQKLVSF